MRHRIFTAINLPENIKNKLAEYQVKWPELPIRWTLKDNIHITLEFLGYISNDELLDVLKKTRELASKQKPFSITLNKICYGPPKKMPPKMVWVVGERIKEFNLVPHITLGRIKIWEFKQIEPEERPEVNEEINLKFEVNSIEVMESVLKKGGPEYIILESCQFQN
ncbi:MAG: hypothetical protein KYQ20_01780 [Candidatus Nealsonbacteria bacterium]|nr:hypothetical protein [Candidatus Nealsonbacteria bacterium]